MELHQPQLEPSNREGVESQITNVQPPYEIISDQNQRIEILREAKRNTFILPVSIETKRGTETYTVNFLSADFRTDKQKQIDNDPNQASSPVGIYLPGFGQYDSGIFDKLDTHLAKHAESTKDGYGRIIYVSVREMPYPQDKVNNQQESYKFDSEIIMKAIKELNSHPELKQVIDLEKEFNKKENCSPFRVYSYSQGSGIAISFVNRLIEEVKAKFDATNSDYDTYIKNNHGRNNLTQFSVTGLDEISYHPELFLSLTIMVLKEALSVGISKVPIINQLYYYLLRKRFDKENKLGPIDDIYLAIRQASNVAKHVLFAAKGNNLGEKMVTGNNQLLKIMANNPEKKSVNKEWDIIYRVPENDLIFDRKALIDNLQASNSITSTQIFGREIDEQIARIVTEFSFKGANSVDFRYVRGIDANHQGPSIKPELYIRE